MNIDFMQSFENKLYTKMLEKHHAQAKNYKPEDNIFPLCSIDASELNAETFKQMICQDVMQPVIVKGFFNDAKAIKEWNIEALRDRYPDTEVSYCVTYPDGSLVDAEHGPLKEVAERILNPSNENVYIHNTAEIFKQHRELLDELNYKKLKIYYNPIAVNAIIQLFMGGPKTGVMLHCANEFNSFIMVEGQKEWTFIPPDFSYALNAILNINMQNAVTPIENHKQDFKYFEEHFPLYNRIPKYVGNIEAGDMLVFAPWWWHAVSNTTDTSIAVATRWTTLKRNTFPRGNIIFQNIQRSNKEFQEYSKIFIKNILNKDIIGDKEIQRNTLGKYKREKDK